MSKGVVPPQILCKSFVAGALFTAIGGFVTVGAFDYPLGTVFRMGPGAFPLLVGGLLSALGLMLAVKGLRHGGDAAPRMALRPMVLVTAAILVFALGLDRIGLVLSTVLLVFISSLAAPPVNWIGTAILAAVLSGLSVLIFHQFLQLPIQLWP